MPNCLPLPTNYPTTLHRSDTEGDEPEEAADLPTATVAQTAGNRIIQTGLNNSPVFTSLKYSTTP